MSFVVRKGSNNQTHKFSNIMKIKTLLILTLFISFNYSVYSEDKIDAIKEYTLGGEILRMAINYQKSVKEIDDIGETLLELVISTKISAKSITKSQNYIDSDNLIKIRSEIRGIEIKIRNLMNCLRYEKVIYQQNISNKSLRAVHSVNRVYFFKHLEHYIKRGLVTVKNHKIKIQNTTAVIAINKNLDLLTKLKEWAELNKITPDEFKQKKNEN